MEKTKEKNMNIFIYCRIVVSSGKEFHTNVHMTLTLDDSQEKFDFSQAIKSIQKYIIEGAENLLSEQGVSEDIKDVIICNIMTEKSIFGDYINLWFSQSSLNKKEPINSALFCFSYLYKISTKNNFLNHQKLNPQDLENFVFLLLWEKNIQHILLRKLQILLLFCQLESEKYFE